ncbi:hypothetical protein L6Q96_17370 [Candidatus Binatia bacterium]|nr:hypothetical protein [Candidatus Binatia bacterium]
MKRHGGARAKRALDFWIGAASLGIVAVPAIALGQGIQLGDVVTTAGQQVQIVATLRTGGGDVAGTLNDFTFATAENRKVTVVRKSNGRPDCAVNPEINKTSTTFAFQPPSCTVDNCTAVRAIVFSSEDVEPIADGSALYTCKVQVAPDAPGGVYPLTISGTILSNPTGGRVCGPAAGNPPCSDDRSGSVTVLGPVPTPTPVGPGVQLSTAYGLAGEVVTIDSRLRTGGGDVAGSQNDIWSFSPHYVAVAAALDGRPDCSVNPEINKPDTTFSFLPPGCVTGCTGVRAIVFSAQYSAPIPDGSILYSCRVRIAGTTPTGVYPVQLSRTILGTPMGQRLCGPGSGDPPCTGDQAGAVSVTGATPTPTQTRNVTPTATIFPGGPGVRVDRVYTTAGQQVVFGAYLSTGGGDVAGTQSDLAFATAENRYVTVVRKSNGRPDCSVNPEIDKSSTTFAFQPPSCTAETCTTVRAIVFSSEDVEPIPEGSLLYTCKVQVAVDAPDGDYPLTVSGTILSNPTGGRVCGPAAGNPPCTGDSSGAVVVGAGGPLPTPPPTATQPPTTPTTTPPIPGCSGVTLSTVHTKPGHHVEVGAAVRTCGDHVAGVQMDVAFGSPDVVIVRKTDGRPDCAVNPGIEKGSTTFTFQPPGCTGDTCSGVRAIVFSSEDVDPVADGALLFACNVEVRAHAAGFVYPLPVSGVILSNSWGGRVCGPAAGNPACNNVDGAVVLDGAADIEVGDVSAVPGQTRIAVPIDLRNDVDVRGMQLVLADNPDRARLSGAPVCEAVGRAAGLVCDANQVGNDILLAVFGFGYSGITPGSGQVVTLYLDYDSPQCSLNAPTWLVPMSSALADWNNQPISHSTRHGRLTCGCRGDVDQNGLTNLFDTFACIDFVMGRQIPSPLQVELADTRCDGQLGVLDCLRIVDMMLGRLSTCAPCP